jgi:Transposase DDE domain group 1
LVSHAGAALLVELADRTGLTEALSEAMVCTRERRSAHDPGRVLRDVAVMLADGGDCVTDMAAYEGQERLFGAKASETTTHRVLKSVDEQLLDAVRAARAAARARVWDAGARPDSITLNIDATLLAAHSDKERAAGTYKHGYGFHPICCYLDETGEALAAILRPGNAGSNMAEDHFAVLALALEQLPAEDLDREILVRADIGGATHAFTGDCRDAGIRVSVGYELSETVRRAILELPETAWVQAIDADGSDRDGAWVAELSDRVDLSAWPQGTRLIVRRERPHPGAQFQIFDEHGYRHTCLPTRPRGARTSPRWSCATAAAPASRTASAPARTPACATSPTTPANTTRPGWSSRSSPRTRSAGPSSPASTASSPTPNPSDCATGCCTRPGGSSATAAAADCDGKLTGPGPRRSPPRSPGCARSHRSADARRGAPRRPADTQRRVRPPAIPAQTGRSATHQPLRASHSRRPPPRSRIHLNTAGWA